MALPHAASAVPLDQPLYGATLRQAVSRFFRKYATFTGRASRSEYWWAMLCTNVLVLVAFVPFIVAMIGQMVSLMGLTASMATSTSPSIELVELMFATITGWMLAAFISLVPMLLVSFGLFVPTLALLVRRHHDAGWSGWLVLLVYATSGIWSYVVGFMPSKHEGLRFEPFGTVAILSPDLVAAPYSAAPGMAGQPFATAPQPGPWQQPAGQQPAGQQPAGQQPAGQQPAGQQQPQGW